MINELLGKTIKEIKVSEDNDEILFICDDGDSFKMFHDQYCCESVSIDDICGDLQDLVGSPVLLAEEVCNEPGDPEDKKDEYDESWTWTFYRIATIRGGVTIRWYGTSNGYYSESVDFEKVKP